MSTFDERLDELVEMLLSGVEGALVLEKMVSDATAFNTDCSVRSYVSRVRRLVMDSSDPRRFHPQYTSTMRAFRARLRQVGPVGPECEAQCDAFFAATLRRKFKMMRQHRRKAFCLGDERVDEAFREIKLLPDNFASFRPSPKTIVSCVRSGVRRTIEKNESVLLISDASKYLDAATATLRTCTERTAITTLGFALMLVSGRRMAEIFNCRSTFAPGPNARSTVFHGQLKTDLPTAYAIPLLCEYEAFRRGWGVFRAKVCAGAGAGELSNDAVHRKYSSNLNKDIKRRLFLPEASSHDCRRYYIRAVWEGYSYEDTTYTFNRVVMAFLGHSTLEESLKYNTVRLRGFTHRFGPRVPIAPTSRQ